MRQRFLSLAFRVAFISLLALTASPFHVAIVSAQDSNGYQYFISDEDTVGIDNYDRCSQFWPSSGRFETYTDNVGNSTSTENYEYSATLHFKLTEEEKNALMCVKDDHDDSIDGYLELDFALVGFAPERGLVNGWEGYSINSNIPGGVHDTAEGDNTIISGDGVHFKPVNIITPAVTGIRISDLEVDFDYYAGISFSGLPINVDDPSPRVAFEWQVSHWASPSNPSEATCIGGPGSARIVQGGEAAITNCIFTTVHVSLSNGYTANEYGPVKGKGQGLPFDGIRFWEFPGSPAPQATEESEPEPAVADSACDDSGIPQITDALTYSPDNPDTTTPVDFSFTITNTGCGTFQPEVLAIGGRDPYDEVSDPLQIRDFSLDPGESREISQTAVLSIPGTHEFFMAYLWSNGSWNEIPDITGVSQHIYIDVSEAGTGQVPQPDNDSGQSSSCSEGALPVVTRFTADDGADSYAMNSASVNYTIEIENRSCDSWDPGYIQVLDYATGYGMYSAQQDVVEPGGVLVIENFNYFDAVGTHTLYIVADNGGVLADESGSEANLVVDVFDPNA